MSNRHVFDQATRSEPRNPIADWFLRGAIGGAFAIFGWEKFDAHSMWPEFFQQVGFGQWFRYFTGVVEILAGVLILIPRTAVAGLALAAVTMAGAAGVHIFVLGHPGNSVIPAAFFIGLATFWFSRRSRL